MFFWFIQLIPLILCYHVKPENFQNHIKSSLSSQLKLIPLWLGTTVNSNSLMAYALTAIPNINSPHDLKQYPGSLLTSLMHPRQQNTIRLLVAVTRQLIKQYKQKDRIKYLLQHSVVWLMPYVNIDGYLQWQKSQESVKLDFRKNRNHNQNLNQCPSSILQGVDINRNFNHQFGSVLTSSYHCGEQYRGQYPFSQKQSLAIKQLFTQYKITLAIDIHAYGNEWIFPFASDKSNKLIQSSPLFKQYTYIIGELKKKQQKVVGCYESLQYVADGVYIDWALEVGTLSFAYQVGSYFNNDHLIAQSIKNALQPFLMVLSQNSHCIQKYYSQNKLIIASCSLVQFKIEISIKKYKQVLNILPLKSTTILINQTGQIQVKIINSNYSQKFKLNDLQLYTLQPSQIIIQSTGNIFSILFQDTLSIIKLITLLILFVILTMYCKLNKQQKQDTKEDSDEFEQLKKIEPIIY